jgi:hypothetical protein
LLLYLPLAVAACQLPIAFAMKLVPDPDEV